MATQKTTFFRWLRDTGFFNRIINYTLLFVTIAPLVVGYLWLVLATFSTKTYGLQVEGWTLNNWTEFLAPGARPFGRSGYASIWVVTFNTFLVGLTMTILICSISAMAGYALSRLNFPGRKGFLSMTLILHAFPSVTLLIAIYFVLDWFSSKPLIGKLIGYNTIGGVALVMVALMLPFGVWLMKGFFDNLSWDMERAALIDGCGRFRLWWEIMLPQIRPGLAALAIFSFITGWGAYLVPATFLQGSATGTLATYMNQFISDTAPTNWNVIAAVGLFQMIPVLIFFIFTQSYLLNIYSGGSKGGV
jgi:inositol-phosphate transport system permease protein